MIFLYLRAARCLGVKTVVERLRRLALVLTDSFGCETCGATWPNMFDKVGRGLLPQDLTDTPINRALWCGVKIGRRTSL